jgi:hypothetical protein
MITLSCFLRPSAFRDGDEYYRVLVPRLLPGKWDTSKQLDLSRFAALPVQP